MLINAFPNTRCKDITNAKSERNRENVSEGINRLFTITCENNAREKYKKEYVFFSAQRFGLTFIASARFSWMEDSNTYRRNELHGPVESRSPADVGAGADRGPGLRDLTGKSKPISQHPEILA